MNKTERVLAALEHREVDRVPVGFWHHFPEEKSKGQACIDAHLDYYHATGQDFIKIMCDGYFGYPNEVLSHVQDASELYRMKPLGEGHPFIREQVERAKAIRTAVAGECCVFYNVFCPLSYFRLEIGWDRMMECIRQDPEAVRYACAQIAEDAKALVRGLIDEAGCDGIYYCVQNAEEFRFTAEEYRNLVTPGDKEVLNYANSLSRYNILHCCGWGGDKNRVEVWQDYEAAAVNWAVHVEDLSLEAGRQFFGCGCVLGGFDNRPGSVLISQSREEIEAYTKQLIQEGGKTGYIIGADCTLPGDIDYERIRWVVETAQKEGR